MNLIHFRWKNIYTFFIYYHMHLRIFCYFSVNFMEMYWFVYNFLKTHSCSIEYHWIVMNFHIFVVSVPWFYCILYEMYVYILYKFRMCWWLFLVFQWIYCILNEHVYILYMSSYICIYIYIYIYIWWCLMVLHWSFYIWNENTYNL